MEKKKTKLTISGNSKKTFKNIESSRNFGKKTVIIDKGAGKFNKKGNFNKSFGSKSPTDLRNRKVF